MIPNPQALGLPCWTPGHPFGVPRVPPGLKWVPKWSQNASQNGCHRPSANQNADCQQNLLFIVFELHFGGARNLQKLVFAVPIPAPVAQPTFWPPWTPQKASGVPSSSHKYKNMSKMESKKGNHLRTIFGHPASFCCPRRPWEPKWFPRLPPRAPRAPPSLDFL